MSDQPTIKPCPNPKCESKEYRHCEVSGIYCANCGLACDEDTWQAMSRREDFHADLLDLYTNGDHKSGHKLSKDIRKLMLKYAPEEGG